VEFLGIWETLYNPNFNPFEFEGIRKEAGLNAFTMSPTRWVELTIEQGIPQSDRLVKLNQIAIEQMRILENDSNRNLLK
jgi:hypothetical protein